MKAEILKNNFDECFIEISEIYIKYLSLARELINTDKVDSKDILNFIMNTSLMQLSYMLSDVVIACENSNIDFFITIFPEFVQKLENSLKKISEANANGEFNK